MPRAIFLFAAAPLLLMVFAAVKPLSAEVAEAADIAAIDGDGAARPVVLLELFTSQGCYSCPPAEKLLRHEYTREGGDLAMEFYTDYWDDLILVQEYARRDDVLPLELHVDYWDDLIYGLAGSWQDPFSQKAFTRRQVAYNRRLVGRGTGWTPQFIIQGEAEVVGTHKGRVDAAIAKVQKDGIDDDGIKWQFSGGGESGWRAKVRGTLQPGGELYYAVFLRRAVTEVPSGENKGKTLVNTNVVLELQNRRISAGRELVLPKLKPGEDCAVWVQNGGSGGVVAAARCPQQSI